MINKELNKKHRDRMKGTCNESVQFGWQDGEFMDFLLGGLPVIRKESLVINIRRWFNRQAPIDENAERERLLRLSEKELLIELILQLQRVNRKCDDISRKIVIWSN